MAREKGNQREEQPIQGTGKAAGRQSEVTERSEAGIERGDRQRAIQTGRERGISTGISRQPGAWPVYAPGVSSLTASPFGLMRRMAEDMDRLLDNFGFSRTGLGLTPGFGAGLDRDLWRGSSTIEQGMWAPQVETFRRGDKLVVRADLPGLRKEDVNVEVNDGMLTISGERSEEHEEDRDEFYRTERSYGEFSRTVPLPEGVNEDQCDATFKDGVLEVTLPAPKLLERTAKQIPIH